MMGVMTSILNEWSAWLPIVAPAWLAGTLLALLSAPLGCLVLWRRMAFFADALAHGTLLGVALALWWQMPTPLGIGLVSVLVVFGLFWLDDERLPSDAVLAVVAVSLLCAGLLTMTQMTQMQANVLGYLFGNLLEMRWADMPWLVGMVVIGMAGLAVTWHSQVKLATHADLAQIAGVSVARQKLLFMGILAGFCAVALQAVGSLLISGLLVLPALTARLYAHSPKQMLVLALILAQVAVTLGVWGSVWLDIQTGLTIVLTLAVAFFMSFAVKRVVG